jgi:hypothetical protein
MGIFIGMACTRTLPTLQSAPVHARSEPGRPGHFIRVAPLGQLEHRRALALGLLYGSRVAVGHAQSPDARLAIEGFVDGPAIGSDRRDGKGEHE